MDSSILILVAILAGAALLFSLYRFGGKKAQKVVSSLDLPSPPLKDSREESNVACIRISGGDETVLAEITPVYFPELSLRKTGMLPNPGLAERLNDFLTPARPMLQRVVAQQGTRYLLRFSKETSAMITKGAARLPNAAGGGFRAMAVSSQRGQIIENAVLLPGGLSNLEKAFMVWELAAIVTLQKYLSDIRNALNRIEMCAMEMMSKWDEKELAILHVNHDTIKRIANEIGTGKLAIADVTSYQVRLDHIEDECAKIAERAYSECLRKKEEMKYLSEAVPIFKDKNWKDKEEDGLRILQEYCRADYKVLAGNLIAGGSAHIRCLISSNPNSVRERIPSRLDILHKNRIEHEEFERICQDRKSMIKGKMISMGKTDHVYQGRFDFACQLYFNELGYIAKDTETYLESMKRSLEGIDSELSEREIEMVLDSEGKVCEAIPR